MRNKFLGTGVPGYHPIAKLRTVLSGLRYAALYDFSVAYKLVVSVIVLCVAALLHERIDFMLIFLSTCMMLAAELANSAIEALCDFVETRHNEKIKVIKDIAAAAAGLAILAWVVVLAFEVTHFASHV